MKLGLNKIILALAISVSLFQLTPTSVFGQASSSPVFWATWSANSYSDPYYLGKNLPSNNSTVNVSFELISNGKVVPLGSKEVRWYLDGQLIKKGVGLKEFSFLAGSQFGSQAVRIELQNFNDGNALVKTILIPISQPEVVLDSPYTSKNNKVQPGEIILKALPYFFNVTQGGSLVWGWKINNQSPTEFNETPNRLTITIPKNMSGGGQILVKARATNSIRQQEKAETMALFTVQ